MFADFGPDLGAYDGVTKFFVRRNCTGGPLKELRLPPASKLCDLLERAGKVLDLESPQRAFFTNGLECTDVDHIDRDEIIHISCGEPFKPDVKSKGYQTVGNFILHEKLGQGGFGSVLKGVHAETGEAAAVKFVPKESFRQFSDLQRVYQEIQALRNLRHPNVIRIFDVADHPDSICFIMEFAAGGELRGYVERQVALREEEARTFFKQIVRAVHYIHSKKIIHRDLKLENILLDANCRCCKIVDFGLSDYVATNQRTVTDAGTEAYLAPEVYNGSSRTSDPYKIDVWCLGVILYALTHGKLPFQRPDEKTCLMLDSDGMRIKEEMSAEYGRLVKAMLTVSPEKRAAVNEITLDPWVTKHRFASWDGTLGARRSGDRIAAEEEWDAETVIEGSTFASTQERVRSVAFAERLMMESEAELPSDVGSSTGAVALPASRAESPPDIATGSIKSSAPKAQAMSVDVPSRRVPMRVRAEGGFRPNRDHCMDSRGSPDVSVTLESNGERAGGSAASTPRLRVARDRMGSVNMAKPTSAAGATIAGQGSADAAAQRGRPVGLSSMSPVPSVRRSNAAAIPTVRGPPAPRRQTQR